MPPLIKTYISDNYRKLYETKSVRISTYMYVFAQKKGCQLASFHISYINLLNPTCELTNLNEA